MRQASNPFVIFTLGQAISVLHHLTWSCLLPNITVLVCLSFVVRHLSLHCIYAISFGWCCHFLTMSMRGWLLLEVIFCLKDCKIACFDFLSFFCAFISVCCALCFWILTVSTSLLFAFCFSASLVNCYHSYHSYHSYHYLIIYGWLLLLLLLCYSFPDTTSNIRWTITWH